MGRFRQNGVPGKDKFIGIIEKYKKPDTTKLANMYVIPCEYTHTHGLVAVIVESYDRTTWFTTVRLKDLIQLQKENRIFVINMRLTPEAADIWTPDLNVRHMYLIIRDIKYPALDLISSTVSNHIIEIAKREQNNYNLFK